MPTLDFKGKQIVHAHHLTVPARTLEPDASKSLPSNGPAPSWDDNLIIHGDSLHALKALLPRYGGRYTASYIAPLQHRQRKLGVQRQREQPADAGVAPGQEPGGRRRPGTP